MEKAAITMSKCFNDKIKMGNESWLITQIKKLLTSNENHPKPHLFLFKNDRSSAKFNTKIIKMHKYNFIKSCEIQSGSIVNPGTEFRHISNLHHLFSHHEDWEELKSIIQFGCDYKLSSPVDETTRKKDLRAMIARGNHKSASKSGADKILHKTSTKEVEKGWIVPVTLESITKIKNLHIIPLGIAHQFSIDEDGNRTPKQRVTHDATFPTPSGDSVNNRTIETDLLPCIYGQCLRRVLHGLLKLRKSYPTTKIYMSKYDLDAAYRRIHVLPSQTLQCVAVIDRLAYIPLRLPFGVAAGPSLYSTMSETVFDLTNDLLNDKTWKLSSLNSPIHHQLQSPAELDGSIPFEPAQELEVYVPLRKAFCDGYIDDFLSIGLDHNEYLEKSQQAPTIAVHTIFRPVSPHEPIQRDAPISSKKLKGEGTPSERKIMLGWLLCTRTSRIFLPEDKQKAWNKDIESTLARGSTTTKELQSMIGRFNHVGYIIPTARYFLNRLRHLLQRCEKYGIQHLKQWEEDDLKLWQQFLQYSTKEGISFNNMCFTKHNTMILTDASEWGLGGYNPSTGTAWRFELPIWMRESMHINLLEFISCTIGIWLELIRQKDSTFIKIKALTDNSSAVGWLYKANFNPSSHAQHDTVARKLAKVLLAHDSSITSQHTPGKHNIIADSLSRDFHLPPNKLTFILQSLFPSQVNKDFRILPKLPREIISWISSLRVTSTKREASPQTPDRSKMGTFFAGQNSWPNVVSKVNSLKDSFKKPGTNCSVVLQRVLDEMSLKNK